MTVMEVSVVSVGLAIVAATAKASMSMTPGQRRVARRRCHHGRMGGRAEAVETVPFDYRQWEPQSPLFDAYAPVAALPTTMASEAAAIHTEVRNGPCQLCGRQFDGLTGGNGSAAPVRLFGLLT